MPDFIYNTLYKIGEGAADILNQLVRKYAYLMQSSYVEAGLLITLFLLYKLITCSFIGSAAHRRGYTFAGGFLLCLFFGFPITVIYYALSPAKKHRDY